MIIDVGLNWLPDLYADTLKEYRSGVSVNKLSYTLLTGSGGVGKFISLYEAIRSQGYRRGSDVFGDVYDSHLLIRGGYHRLSILKALRYKSVPVRIRQAEPDFEKFYKTMLRLQGHGTSMYHPNSHWALSMWKIERGRNRLAIIKKYLPQGKHSFLDLGCYTGYFSNVLAANGHRVVGIDHNKGALFCARYMTSGYAARTHMVNAFPLELGHLPPMREYARPVFYRTEIESFLEEAGKFDYALFLSIYRWLDDPKQVIRSLGDRTRLGIFADAKAGYEKRLIQAIVSLTPFSVATKIGVENGRSQNYRRSLFLFSRP
jgi:SAM-dependent methyltransferase